MNLSSKLKRRQFIKNCVLMGSALPGAGLIGCINRSKNTKKTNLILITSDTTRAQSIGCYGCSHDTMPTVDLMAEQGALFHNSYAVCNWTLPSHASIFTGIFPDRLGLLSNTGILTSEFPTLTEILRDAGYTCAAFLGVCSLNQPDGIARAFNFIDWESKPDSEIFDISCQRKSGSYIDNVIQFLRSMKNQKSPFFLWLHSFDAHSPYLPTGKYSKKYLTPDIDTFDLKSKIKKGLQDIEGYQPEYPRKYMLSQYLGELSYWDNNIRKIFEVIHEKGNLDDTLVVFTSDHGENVGEGNVYGHGFVNEEVLRIPLIFWHPDLISPQKRISPTTQTDILPTVLSLLSIPKQSMICEGNDLKPLLMKEVQEDENRLLFAINSNYHAAAVIDVKHGKKVRKKLCICSHAIEYPPNEIPSGFTDNIIENNFLCRLIRKNDVLTAKWSGQVTLNQPVQSGFLIFKSLNCDTNLFIESFKLELDDEKKYFVEFPFHRWNKPDPQEERFPWTLNYNIFTRPPAYAVILMTPENEICYSSKWIHYRYIDDIGILSYEESEYDKRIIQIGEKQEEIEWGEPYESSLDSNDLLGKLNAFLNRDPNTPKQFWTPTKLIDGCVTMAMTDEHDSLPPDVILTIHLAKENNNFDLNLKKELKQLGYIR